MFGLSVAKVEEIEDFIIWQGSRGEEERRRRTQESKKGKRPFPGRSAAGRGRAAGPRKARKASQKSSAPTLSHGKDDTNDMLLLDSDPEPDLNLDDDSLLDLLVPAAVSAGEAAGAFLDDPASQNESEDDVAAANGNDDHSPGAGADKVVEDGVESDRSLSPDLEQMEAFILSDVSDTEPAQKLLDADPAVGPEPVPEAPAPEPQPKARAAPEPPRQAIARPSGTSRSNENREVFAVPPYGELHYYHLTGQMVAFCHLRNSTHADNCRKQMTTCPVREGASGRPIGALVSWLKLADQHKTRTEHVHCAIPTLAQRQDGRRLFESLPGHESFSQYEKEKRPHDNSEPDRL